MTLVLIPQMFHKDSALEKSVITSNTIDVRIQRMNLYVHPILVIILPLRPCHVRRLQQLSDDDPMGGREMAVEQVEYVS
jgi:hypothetical protein